MLKLKKTVIWIFSIILSLVIIAYVGLSLLSSKPGMNGFQVTNNMIKLLVSGKDYIKVKENCYLCREGFLDEIVFNDFDSFRFIKHYGPIEPEEVSKMYWTDVAKGIIAQKNNIEYRTGVPSVWSPFVNGIHSVYFKPYTEWYYMNLPNKLYYITCEQTSDTSRKDYFVSDNDHSLVYSQTFSPGKYAEIKYPKSEYNETTLFDGTKAIVYQKKQKKIITFAVKYNLFTITVAPYQEFSDNTLIELVNEFLKQEVY